MCSKCLRPPELWITICCGFFFAYQASHTLHTDHIPQMKPITHEAYSFHCKSLNSICYHLTLKKPNKQNLKQNPKPNNNSSNKTKPKNSNKRNPRTAWESKLSCLALCRLWTFSKAYRSPKARIGNIHSSVGDKSKTL